LDRATDFVDAAHWPDSREEMARWRKTHGWRPKDHEDSPMLPSRFVQASCHKCHLEVLHIAGAERWNLGRDLIERYGCFGCHKIKGFEGLRRPGPLLARLPWKTSPEWAYRWIENPTAFRPSTLMPRFFGLSNTSSAEDLARTRQEIRGIVAFLFEKAEKGSFPPLPGRGDARRGEGLVTQIGCLGCHAIARLEKGEPTFRRRFGPNLDGIGSKARPEWIYAWLKDPKKYFPDTRMPNLRLTDLEARDITEYLTTLKVEGWTPGESAMDPQLLDRLVADQLRARLTSDQAREKMAVLSPHEKEVYLGERMINRYGCFGCHLIPGFEATPPIGTELSEEGSKEVDRFDFGFVKIPETRHDWITQKLENPRIFDEGKIKTPDEKLKMPLFNFSPEERSAVVTAVLSFTKEKPILSSTRLLDARDKALEAGRRIVFEHNCQGCHDLEGEGQEIRATIARRLVEEGAGAEDADVRAAAFSPPLLTGEGARVRPDWLFRFLKAPSPIRPWLQVRMPTFGFSDEEADKLLHYFSALSESPFPFETLPAHPPTPPEIAAAKALVSRDYLNCFSCHQQGTRKPEGPPEGWAPDLALARERLRPDWIVKWIQNPQKLFPGTKMPTYFDPDNYSTSGPDDILGGDEDRQIVAIRDYLLTLANDRALR
ncbi:MAG TPA: c-type cytochrome, partial [Candidatus Polarisedimenticolia bacterium]|nr:c-type cytochrome [Candidatus Polarisedimenticolia bacterium]